MYDQTTAAQSIQRVDEFTAVDKPRQESGVARELDRMENKITKAQALADGLESRVGGVLRPPSAALPEMAEAAPGVTSALMERLNDYNGRLDRLQGVLAALNDRIDL